MARAAAMCHSVCRALDKRRAEKNVHAWHADARLPAKAKGDPGRRTHVVKSFNAPTEGGGGGRLIPPKACTPDRVPYYSSSFDLSLGLWYYVVTAWRKGSPVGKKERGSEAGQQPWIHDPLGLWLWHMIRLGIMKSRRGGVQGVRLFACP